ncbi:MAG: integrase core domain-containing protein [Pseudomonadota bacterium]
MGSKRFDQEQKLAILKGAAKVGIKEAARTAEVHYTSVYQWQRQMEALGEEGFVAYKPSTPGRGIKKISPKKEEAVLDTWKRYPGLGPGQVRNQLRRQGFTVSMKTVRQIMEANGYRSPRKKARKKDGGERFEARRPLELVQMDILEFFTNKLKVFVLILLDDFSRFILGFRLLTRTSIDEVIGLVQETIDRYGKMEEMLTDRGFVFYSWQGANRFERYLEVEGIDHTHASAHHPQTLGKIEAFNGHLRRELLERERFSGVEQARAAMAQWIFHYNYERTHQGLGGGLFVPADRFHGLTDLALSNLGKGLDLGSSHGYSFRGIERSIINLTTDSEGKVTLYLLGRPITVA